MKKQNSTAKASKAKATSVSVAAEAPKAEVVDTTISTVDTVDTTSIIPAEAPKAEANNTSISANPTAVAAEAPKAKKVLDPDSLSVSLASIEGYRKAEEANANAEERGFPRHNDEKNLAEVTLLIHKENARIRMPVYDGRGGLYPHKMIWVSYLLNTDGTVCKNTVQLHRNGKPTEADLMVDPVDPNKASK